MSAPDASGFSEGTKTIKHQRIRQQIECQIIEGELPLGAQVPTEKDLCARNGVSRITARRALEDLRRAGIIERTRGRGSFVVSLPQRSAFSALVGTEIGILATRYLSDDAIQPHSDSWGARIIQGMSGRLAEEGFHMTILPATGPEDVLWKRVDDLGPRLAGVLGFTGAGPAIFEELDRRDIPWVTINPLFRQQSYNFVSANNFAGGERVAREFVRLKYQSVLFLSSSLRVLSNADRFLGFLTAWIEAGRPDESLRRLGPANGIDFSETECDTLGRIFTGPGAPRAVFCAGDQMASTVLRVCREHNLAVPRRMAVVGGTGLQMAEHLSPTLTVLAQPMNQLGLAAEDMLVEMIKTQRRRLPGRYIESPLIRRASCPIGEPSV